MLSTTAIDGISTYPKKRILSDVKRLRFKILDFESLRNEREEELELPSLAAFQEEWTLLVFPRGDSFSDEDDEYVSIYLKWVLTAEPDDELSCFVTFTLHLPSGVQYSNADTLFYCDGSNITGCSEFIKREDLLDKGATHLSEEGTLIIDLELQDECYSTEPPEVWYPKPEAIAADFGSMLETSSCSDVTISVAGKDFHLHRCILEVRAPVLFALLKDGSRVSLEDDADPTCFEALIRHVYMGKCPSYESCEQAKSLLLTADRFDCKHLKLSAESAIVKNFLDETNAAELLLFGHSHSCALLKEFAVQLCCSKASAVTRTEGWKQVKESSALLAELFEFSTTWPIMHGSTDLERMPVAQLRERLIEGNLDIDGSREILLNRLKDAGIGS